MLFLFNWTSVTYLHVAMLEETQILVNVANDGHHKWNVVLRLNNNWAFVVVVVVFFYLEISYISLRCYVGRDPDKCCQWWSPQKKHCVILISWGNEILQKQNLSSWVLQDTHNACLFYLQPSMRLISKA